MKLRFVIVDVFTDVALAGNQLGVFTDARGLAPQRMQKLAHELGFSECTFVLPAEADGDVRVRIFTPTSELPFAGHPVLGTAFVVGTARRREVVRLETGSGTVPVRLVRADGVVVFGRMDQPIPTTQAFAEVPELFAALGVARSELPVELYFNGVPHVYVALRTEAEVAALRPRMDALAALGDLGFNCFAGAGKRWKTRCFVPELGVPEDPATGSAAGPLALHLARHGRIEWGDEIEIRQGAEIGRPSTLYARVTGSADAVENVEVGGSAVVAARGEFSL